MCAQVSHIRVTQRHSPVTGPIRGGCLIVSGGVHTSTRISAAARKGTSRLRQRLCGTCLSSHPIAAPRRDRPRGVSIRPETAGHGTFPGALTGSDAPTMTSRGHAAGIWRWWLRVIRVREVRCVALRRFVATYDVSRATSGGGEHVRVPARLAPCG
jgi:hypothetical protein